MDNLRECLRNRGLWKPSRHNETIYQTYYNALRDCNIFNLDDLDHVVLNYIVRASYFIDVMDDDDIWYRSEIIGFNIQTQMVLVHFLGWSAKYDTWLYTESSRLQPLGTKTWDVIAKNDLVYLPRLDILRNPDNKIHLLSSNWWNNLSKTKFSGHLPLDRFIVIDKTNNKLQIQEMCWQDQQIQMLDVIFIFEPHLVRLGFKYASVSHYGKHVAYVRPSDLSSEV